jgi:YD repeat-containing protein
MRRILVTVTFVLSMLFCATLHAQDYPDKTDVRPYAPHDGSSMETVSLSNGSLVMNIPLWSFHQRGKLKLDFWLSYNSPNFDYNFNCTFIGAPNSSPGTPSNTSGGSPNSVPFGPDPCASSYPACPTEILVACISTWEISQQSGDGTANYPNDSNMGVLINSSTDYAITPITSVKTATNTNPYQLNVFYGYFFNMFTPDGGSHRLMKTASGDFRALDGTGWQYIESSCTLRDNEGTSYVFDCTPVVDLTGGNTPSYIPNRLLYVEDTNGNKITISAAGGWTDTEGRVIPPISGRGLVQMPAGDVPGCPAGTTYSTQWQLPGVASPIDICESPVSIATHINWPYDNPNQPSKEVNYATPMISEIVLPSGDTWSFNNSPMPGDLLYGSGFNYGALSQITLPGGGTIHYTWLPMKTECIAMADTIRSAVHSRTVQANSSAPPATWLYANTDTAILGTTTGKQVEVIDPLGNVDVHTLTYEGVCSYYETELDSYDSTNTPLKSEVTTLQQLPAGWLPFTSPIPNAALPIAKTTIWPDGKSKTTTITYDQGYLTPASFGTPSLSIPYGSQIQVNDYGFTSGTGTGTLLRSKTNSYWTDGNSPTDPSSPLYWNILTPLKQVQITDAANGNIQATMYAYDESPLSSGNASQTVITGETIWNPSPPNGSVRGNLTSVSKLYNTSGYLTNRMTYNDTGTMSSHTLPSNAPYPDTTTTYGYSATYQGALLTSITNSMGQTESFAYNSDTDLPSSSVDENNNLTSYAYWPDTRLRSITSPATQLGNPVTEYFYPSPTLVKKRAKQDSSTWVTSETFYDGIGRTSSTKLWGGCPSDYIGTETTYDLLGRVSTVTNPHCGGTSSSTDGTTTHQYDALNRPTTVYEPDGSYQQWTYFDDTTTFWDENRVAPWVRTNDALGRLAQVIEPGSLETDYTYDAFNNLLSVNQLGGSGDTPRQSRTFTYDSLSRLTTAFNPEAGTICYGTNAGANAHVTAPPIPSPPTGPAPAPSGSGCTGGYDAHGNLLAKTDALGVQTNYSYDSLNRLVGKSYTIPSYKGTYVATPTPASTYTYNNSTSSGLVSNSVGRLVSEGTVPANNTTRWVRSLEIINALLATAIVFRTRTTSWGMCCSRAMATLPTRSTIPTFMIAWEGCRA